MEPDEYEEVVDETMDEYDSGQDLADAQLENYETYSQQKEKSDLFAWFWKVTRLSQPERIIRVGNLDKQEIGNASVSIRDAMNLANLGKIFHHEAFANYWEETAAITSASSMAKKGWFMELSISQRKIRERDRKGTFKERAKLFGKKSPPSEQ